MTPSAQIPVPAALDELDEEFTALWRSMASLWGISPTMAEIHGLLYITGEALTMDDIMERLNISRGNVSMNLGKLVEWNLVQRAHKRGDRRDYYESITDVWEIFTQIAAQRKRREIDPVLSTLHRCEKKLDEVPGEEEAVAARQERIRNFLSVLTLMDSLAQRFFESQKGLRQAIDLLSQPETEG